MAERADRTARTFVVAECWPPWRVRRQPCAWIYCPCLSGLGPAHCISISALPIHDANGAVLDALRKPEFVNAARRPDYVGLFLLDPFRRMEFLLEAVKSAGVSGIVNFPTVGAFDGELLTALEHVGLGIAKEMEALKAASALGLRTASLRRANKSGWRLIDEEKGDAAVILSQSEWRQTAGSS